MKAHLGHGDVAIDSAESPPIPIASVENPFKVRSSVITAVNAFISMEVVYPDMQIAVHTTEMFIRHLTGQVLYWRVYSHPAHQKESLVEYPV